MVLESLNCSSNQLTSLDVSVNVKLEVLHCTNNLLTSLDLSKNAELGKLRCDPNVDVPYWGLGPDKKCENTKLEYGEEGYLFERASQVKFQDANNCLYRINVQNYDKVIVTYTCDREITGGDDGWGGKATLSTTNERFCSPYSDGLYKRYFVDLPYVNGGYKVEYDIHGGGYGNGSLIEGWDPEDVELINCISVQLEGDYEGINLRLKSIEFIVNDG